MPSVGHRGGQGTQLYNRLLQRPSPQSPVQCNPISQRLTQQRIWLKQICSAFKETALAHLNHVGACFSCRYQAQRTQKESELQGWTGIWPLLWAAVLQMWAILDPLKKLLHPGPVYWELKVKSNSSPAEQNEALMGFI